MVQCPSPLQRAPSSAIGTPNTCRGRTFAATIVVTIVQLSHITPPKTITVMPKHTIIAPGTFRVLLQFTPFIYPPTPFSFGRRQHMILVGNYFPTNYFACQKFSTPPPHHTKSSRNGIAKGDLGKIQWVSTIQGTLRGFIPYKGPPINLLRGFL
jgi:hypothetical protein